MTQEIRRQVFTVSQKWIAQFNQGNVPTCIATYKEDAIMSVAPFGTFTGREKIAGFWLDFAQKEPGELVYRNINIKVLDHNHAVLSASWNMNIAAGFISKELWVRETDGNWYLEQDDFTVLTTRETPLTSAQKTALILVDLQNDYFAGGKFPLVDTEKAADRAAKLLAHFRANKQPVIHVQHLSTPETGHFFHKDTEGAEIHHSVAPRSNETLVVKTKINSFLHTELEQQLIEQGIEKLVVVGAMSQMCVEGLSRAASDLGYDITVITDACAAPTLGELTDSHIAGTAFSVIEFAYGQLTTSDEYLALQGK